MTELSRTSALASRHRELGSDLEDWNGMGTAWGYHTNPNDEHDAVRESAGLIDMSPLKKVMIRGADALSVVDHVMSRDMCKVAPGQSVYGSVLNDAGMVSDDAIVANCSDDEWLFCHGSGSSMERIQESASGKNVSIELDDDLHDIALQGPKSLALLNRLVAAPLDSLGYFHHTTSELFGRPVRLSRTGYSGERGYEIFAASNDIGAIWDGILSEGADDGVMPASFTALDKVRIEAGLLFYGYDMTEEQSPWEVGLGFTVSRKKGDFRGKDAVFALEGKERVTQAGLVIAHNDALAGGETLWFDDQHVGVINSPGWSHRSNQSLALAHVRPDLNAEGTILQVKGEGVETTASITALPFYDPRKSRTHA